jgi:hypothetical protein
MVDRCETTDAPTDDFKIGIISDTHGLLRPEAKRQLADVDPIIHRGDIGRPEIIDALRRIAPVSAIRGNVDTGDWTGAYPETEVVRLVGRSIYVLHDLKTLQVDLIARGIDIVVSGHFHVPKIDTDMGVLYFQETRGRAASGCRYAGDDRRLTERPAIAASRSRRRVNPSRNGSA